MLASSIFLRQSWCESEHAAGKTVSQWCKSAELQLQLPLDFRASFCGQAHKQQHTCASGVA